MQFTLLVTGPAYGTQQATTAWLFANALIDSGHRLSSIFFYREGVTNANQLTAPASDEFDLVRGWQQLSEKHSIVLYICVAAALRRGVTDQQQAKSLTLPAINLQPGFKLTGLGSLAEAVLNCQRLVQF